MSWLVRLLFGGLSVWYRILPRFIHLRIHCLLAILLSKLSFKAIERNLRVIDRFARKRGDIALDFAKIRRKFWNYTFKNLMDYMLFLFNGNRDLENLVMWKSGEDILQEAYDTSIVY